MKTSDKLYNINANISTLIIQGKSLKHTHLIKVNLELGKIIKEIRELEDVEH